MIIEFNQSIPQDSVHTSYMPSSSTVNVLFPNMKNIIPITKSQFHDNLYGYVSKNKLQDPSDMSIVNNDSSLESLFGCKRMLFSSVNDLITSQNLLIPITAKNLANPKRVSFTLKRSAVSKVIEGDIEVFSPVLFHERARALLLRVKRRELEYTSSRSKASRMLAPSNANAEDALKNSIERCVTGKAGVQDIQTYLALSKAAPPGSEAQKNGKLHSKLIDLWRRVEAHSSLARANRQVVDLILSEPSHSKEE